jgi:competence protein ComEC
MKEFLARQFENLFLWAPFVMAIGAGTYFSMPSEPAVAFPLLIALLCAAVLISRRHSVITTGILLFAFGFFYACGFTRMLDTPMLYGNMRNLAVSGIVTNIDYTDSKSRVFVKIPANLINRNLAEDRTALIRLSVGPDKSIPKIGDQIDATVAIFRPSEPAAPGSFDFARWAYFNGISATGYLIDYNADPVSTGQSAGINSLRDHIHGKTNSFLSDALVLGYKNAIPRDDAPIWTATGVGHVWSISGFHITLMSGWLFALFYAIFRSVPALTRRWPARYPAMICAWAGLLFYLFLSGADVATVRAFLMATLIFAAFLFGRDSFSLRNVCIAFVLIFLMNPHYVMQPGFQLSFAAIFGLVWFFGGAEFQKTSFVRKYARLIGAAIMTSVIATVFTAPFVAHHFYSLPIYGLIGNLILLPVFSFTIMPLALIGAVAGLFGFHGPLTWAHSIYDWALMLAIKISNLPFSTIQIPQVSGFALIMMLVGLLCLVFIKNTNKFKFANYSLCLIFVAAGIAVVTFSRRPLFYATKDHELVAFVNDGKLEFNKAKASNHYFAFESWKHLNYEPTDTKNHRRKCDRGVCIYKTRNWNLAYIQRFVPLAKNIAKLCDDPDIDFIVSYFDIESEKCDRKIMRGGFVIYESGKIRRTPDDRWWHNAVRL